jgi:hypothetical protein
VVLKNIRSDLSKSKILKNISKKKITDKLQENIDGKRYIDEMENQLERKYKKIQAALLIKNILMAHSTKKSDLVRKGNVLVDWWRFMLYNERSAFNQELEAIYTVVNERAFRENLFRTKVKLTQGELESKLQILEQVATVHSTKK